MNLSFTLTGLLSEAYNLHGLFMLNSEKIILSPLSVYEKCILTIHFLPIPWFGRPAQIGILEVSTRERMRREIAVASGFCTYFLGLNT